LPFDRAEYSRWMGQAEYTLRSAAQDRSSGYFSWSCFKAQQAAEYALKALLYGLGLIPVGHSVLRLLNQLENRGRRVEEGLRNDAMTLDRYYPNEVSKRSRGGGTIRVLQRTRRRGGPRDERTDSSIREGGCRRWQVGL